MNEANGSELTESPRPSLVKGGRGDLIEQCHPFLYLNVYWSHTLFIRIEAVGWSL
jgi:hypothetical protein